MPKGPHGQKRPADVIGNAIMVARIATGEARESFVTPNTAGKDPAAVMLGRKGGLKGGRARADSLSPMERKKIAQDAANKRWKAPKSEK